MNIRISLPRSLRSAIAVLSVAALCSPWTLTPVAHAVSSWSPTLLVNTESFQTIDSGDGSTDIELRFGTTAQTLKFLTTGKFQFSRGLSVQGNLSGSTLRVDGNADVWGNLSATGSIKTKADLTINSDADTNDATATFGNSTGNQTVKFLNGVQEFELSKGARINGTISGSGTINAQNNINTRADITLNADRGAADAALTFGNATTNQTIIYSHANQRFEISKDVKVTGGVRASGNLSGSTLNVDGNTVLRGTTYQWPTSQGGTNTYLKNDGAGGLSWSTTSVPNGSGGMLSIHPEFPNAVYTASGSAYVGQLTYSGALGTENLYRWTTSKGTLQDYWVAVRLQVPKNFTSFTGTGGIQVRVRTATTSAADNHVTFRLTDTNNAAVAVTNNAQLVSAGANVWRTINIGNVAAGTYTPLGYIKLLFKLAATSSGAAELGNIDIRWSTTTP